MSSFSLHALVKRGALPPLREFLDAMIPGEVSGIINALDGEGLSPLMHAVANPQADAEVAKVLLAHGADPHQNSGEAHAGGPRSVMALALGGGDPETVRLLRRHGADLLYAREDGYGALVDAVHGRDVSRDGRLLDLLRLIISGGVDLNGVTSYRESGLRVLSRLGRFDGVSLLLDAGADPGQLGWTPLLRAVALGSLDDVAQALGDGASPEERDYWERTAWLLAIQTGDVAKARLLRERGADVAARGRCGKPPPFYAVESHHLPMLRWLLEIRISLEATDQFGCTVLMEAVEHDNLEAVEVLLEAGAAVDAVRSHDQTALSGAKTRDVAMTLLNAGADPRRLPNEGQRAVLGFTPEPDESLLEVTPVQFAQGRTRRFGNANPERFNEPFWEGMIRSGITGYQAAQMFRAEPKFDHSAPVWCAHRFGQSLTFLPDGRIVQVGGEHEDHYDPDFCIYNDVFVHEPAGAIHIFGYPEAVFPPTDFHTATLLGNYLYLIGCLGYPAQRHFGYTPVFRLDTVSWRMEAVQTRGSAPEWIFGHRAHAVSDHVIRIGGGTVVTWEEADEVHAPNARSYHLDTGQGTWTEVG